MRGGCLGGIRKLDTETSWQSLQFLSPTQGDNVAEFPALPLFTDAYMADTRHLTAAQHGAYLLLLMTAWRMPDCKLPDDDRFLSRCASMDLRTWKANRAVIMAFWNLDSEQKWCQHRLLDERKYVEHLSSKNSEAGKASALKRKNRGSTTVATKPQPDCNPHTHTHLSKDKDKSLPLLECWQDFKLIYPKARAGSWQQAELAYRKAIKRGHTEAKILQGATDYANSQEVARGFAKGAAAWLNDDRFLNDYSARANETHQRTTGGGYPSGGSSYGRKEPFKRNVEVIGGKK